MSDPSSRPLVDRPALLRARRRVCDPDALFLHRLARDGIEERLAMVNRPLNEIAIVTGQAEPWEGLRSGAVLVADDDTLPLPRGRYDLVVHAMALHWAEDPVGQMVQCRLALKPDGLFLAVLPAGRTLHELRAALAEAEAAITGGLSPRILPMADLRDLGGLLQRAGFALPVADAETHRVRYPSPWHLMRDLRAMGETNALSGRLRRFTRRAVLRDAARRYPGADPDGAIHATVELVTLTGWAPDPSQPQPLRPGSAATRLAAALGTDETPVNDPPGL